MEYPSNLSEKDKYWFDLIQECRASGKTDYQWLEENNIAAPTFYYHVKKLREKACKIPYKRAAREAEIQEVVPMLIDDDPELVPTVHRVSEPDTVAVRINFHGVSVEISSSATQDIIQNTLSALRLLC